MKKIEFGFSNDSNPNGTWEGLGLNENLLITNADYYGSVEYEGNHYVVAKIVDDPYNRYPQMLNKFIVKQALYDMYPDGSGILMLNQENNGITNEITNYLNSAGVSDKITGVEDIISSETQIHPSSNAFKLAELGETIVSTSISPDVFEAKNEAIKQCRKTISQMQMEMSDNYSM